VSYASKQGYPTFSFDRLGNGISSHPDGLLEVQTASQAATVNELIKMAKAGATPFPRKFTNTIIVGCSLGSLVANTLLANYPDAINAAILTGFSKSWVNTIPGFTATAELLPAAFVDPNRFGRLGPTYLAADNELGVEYLLFYKGTKPTYDPALVQADFDARGTITLGEAISGAIPPSAPNFKGSVYVMTGQQDVVFCGKLGLKSDPPSDCLSPQNILAETGALYPKAANFAVSLHALISQVRIETPANVEAIVVRGAKLWALLATPLLCTTGV
jgi:pimeloyl-ACP methyl ester carboxylesterase